MQLLRVLYFVCALLFAPADAFFSYSTRYEDELSNHHITRGFFIGTSSSASFAARINANYEYPASVHVIEFSSGHLSPDINPVFHLVTNHTHNHRPIWSNGEHNIFYLTPEQSHNAPYGTWLLGHNIGIDSGMAFLKPKHFSVVPVSSTDSWHFHDGKSWKPSSIPVKYSFVTSISLTSISLLRDKQHSDLHSSHVLWRIPDLAVTPHLATLLDGLSINSVPPATSDRYPVYWDAAASHWTSFSQSQVIPYAYPLLCTTASTSEDDDATIYHLIADEFYTSYWRLFLRSSDAGDELTTIIHFTSQGVVNPEHHQSVQLTELSTYEQSLYNEYTTQRLDSIAVGDYVWLWQRTADSIESLFLRATYVNDSALVFQLYPTHRSELLQRSQLQQVTELIVARAEYDGYGFYRDSNALDVISLFHMPLVAEWLQQHLLVHEGFVAEDISSCFMYHAAVLIPEQLIYAAELMCLLIGAKPITMTNFPLVSGLSSYILNHIAARSRLGQQLGYVVHTYKGDETLLLYRHEASALVTALQPQQQAQALHIAPYPLPDSTPAQQQRILEEQVYNSFWNGYVLGYNERFVASYCENYNADMSKEAKISAMRRAKIDVEAYFRNKSLSFQVVAINNYENLVSEEILDEIEMSLLGH